MNTYSRVKFDCERNTTFEKEQTTNIDYQYHQKGNSQSRESAATGQNCGLCIVHDVWRFATCACLSVEQRQNHTVSSSFALGGAGRYLPLSPSPACFAACNYVWFSDFGMAYLWCPRRLRNRNNCFGAAFTMCLTTTSMLIMVTSMLAYSRAYYNNISLGNATCAE